MDRKISAVTGDMNIREVKLDPGNLMLVVYTLVIALIILCGGLLQADGGSVQPADKLESLNIEQFRQGELPVPDAAGAAGTTLQLG